ncbi:hypothetical protein [Pseudomonas sp. A34-9]|uniref:hypothetical protein n=1 Tax=Pseudomonas sp. A34-9 TaxID=3034675 RepID=UPI00321F7486
MRMAAEEQYDELLKMADTMEQEGLITAEEWRQLVRKAGVKFSETTERLEGGTQDHRNKKPGAGPGFLHNVLSTGRVLGLSRHFDSFRLIQHVTLRSDCFSHRHCEYVPLGLGGSFAEKFSQWTGFSGLSCTHFSLPQLRAL